jgi:hypothetical protein
MAITYSNSNFIETTSTPAFQNWESVSPTNFIHIQTGVSLVAPQIVLVKFKDVIGTTIGTQYSAFRIKAVKYYFNTTSGIDWLIASSTFFAENLTGLQLTKPLTSNSTVDSLTLNIQNLSLLNVGVHECKIEFIIEGLNASGIWNDISSYTHSVTLTIYENEQVTWTPDNFVMNFIQGTPKPEEIITMNGEDWHITTPVHFILESDDPEVTITTQVLSSGTQYIASGSGEKQIKLKIGDYWDTAPVSTPVTSKKQIRVMTGVSTLVGNIFFKLNVFAGQINFHVDVFELYFEAIKGGTEPTPIDIFVYAANPYTITKPMWLNVIPTAESSPGIFSNLNIFPIDSSNLSGGTYTGEIVLTSTAGGYIIISVTYVLHEFVSLPYSTTEFNFTKDPLFLSFFTTIPDTYFDIKMNVEIFDWFFQGGTSKSYVVPFKVPLYNLFQKENIGERIEKMMAKYAEVNPYALNLYNAANVSLEIQEKKYPSNEIVRETTLNPMKFLSGITPKNKIGNDAILEISNGTKRITPNSFDYLNLMLSPGTEKPIEIFKNGVSQEFYVIATQYHTFKETIPFSHYDLKPGDIVEVRVYLDALNTVYLSKKYEVFPKTEYSNMIIWEDDYKMMQSYEFTGKHTVKSDYSFQNFTKKKNLIEYLKNVHTKDTEKITINTGYVPKSDIVYINNIIKARRVWLYISDDELVELNNETKSLIYDDIDRELNHFDLEFTINKKYNEESHSF